MKLLIWNYIGLESPSTISQLNEAARLYLPDLALISETKQKRGFINTVCRSIKCRDRWECVDPIGKSGGLWIFWGLNVQVCQLIKLEFCVEVECVGDTFEGKCWFIFVYLSTDDQIRKMQWDYLKQRRSTWGRDGLLVVTLMK